MERTLGSIKISSDFLAAFNRSMLLMSVDRSRVSAILGIFIVDSKGFILDRNTRHPDNTVPKS